MKGLPETSSRTKPFVSRKRTRTRGLTAGSFGILKFERGHQRLVVGGDWLLVFLEAFDVAGDGVFGHALGFRQIPAIRHAAGQGRDNHGESALGFGSQDEIEMASGFFHWAHSNGGAGGRSNFIRRGRRGGSKLGQHGRKGGTERSAE